MTLSRFVLLLFCCFRAVNCLAADSVQLPGSLNWHQSFEDASDASRESEKPILTFVYAEQHPPSVTLANVLMPREKVAENLRKFELLGVPYGTEAHQDFLSRYDIQENTASARKGTGEVKLYPTLPLMLYLESDGTEYLRNKGYTPAPGQAGQRTEKLLETAAAAFAAHLDRTRRLITLLRKVDRDPTAEAHAAAGHLFMEMNRYGRAEKHLDRAMAMDPNNDTGAFADAYLDKIILNVPEAPEQALRQLEDFHVRFPDSERLLEGQYYRAVCLVALERFDEALPILSSVCEKAADTPVSMEPWYVPATRLLHRLEQRQKGS